MKKPKSKKAKTAKKVAAESDAPKLKPKKKAATEKPETKKQQPAPKETPVRFDKRAKLAPEKEPEPNTTPLAPLPVDAQARESIVYQDEERNSCIVASIVDNQVVFVTMEGNFVNRHELPKSAFERRFKELPGYPLLRAIKIYKRVGGANRISAEAEELLDTMLDPTSATKRKEQAMKTKAETKKGVKAVAAPKEKTPKVNKYAGKKIKGLVKSSKAAELREGSNRAKMLDFVLKSKNTDDVLGKKVPGTKDTVLTGANLAGMLKRKHISLS